MHGNYSNVATLLYSSLKKDHWSVWVLYAKGVILKLARACVPRDLDADKRTLSMSLFSGRSCQTWSLFTTTTLEGDTEFPL